MLRRQCNRKLVFCFDFHIGAPAKLISSPFLKDAPNFFLDFRLSAVEEITKKCQAW